MFFFLAWFLQVVLLLIRKKSGGSFMLNLRPFFSIERKCAHLYDYIFSITKFDNYYNLEN